MTRKYIRTNLHNNAPRVTTCQTCGEAPVAQCGCRCAACIAECGHRIDCGFHATMAWKAPHRKSLGGAADEHLMDLAEGRLRHTLTELELTWLTHARKSYNARGRLDTMHRMRMRRIAYPAPRVENCLP